MDQQSQTLSRLEQVAQECEAPPARGKAAEEAHNTRKEAASSWWFVPYGVALAILFAALLVLNWMPSLMDEAIAIKVRRYLLGGVSVAIVLGLTRAIEIYAIGRLKNAVSRFNLRRILRLGTGLVLVFIVVSVLFVNWYAAAVSLGLISLILGFALQTPISSFIGWVYILARAPYRVGDRIEIGDARGDVIDVSYLDTTIWEIGGRHLSTDHPSGRLIKFPNTNVFTTPVFNYSWPLFPYIWNEITFEIAYESDLDFVATTMENITVEQLGPDMVDKVKRYRELLSATPVNDVEVRERPSVFFHPSNNTWLEATVRYLVDPKEAGRVKSELTRNLLRALNAAPDRVLFPKSNMR